MEAHEMEFRLARLEKRMDKIEAKEEETLQKFYELDKTQGLIIQKLDSLLESVETIKAHQEKTAQEPADAWKKAKWAVISSVISALVAGIIGYLAR